MPGHVSWVRLQPGQRHIIMNVNDADRNSNFWIGPDIAGERGSNAAGTGQERIWTAAEVDKWAARAQGADGRL